MALQDKGSVDFAINYISTEFKVGDELPGQSIFCGLIGIGKQQLREAIVRLEAKGCLQVKHGKPTKVIKDALDCEDHY